MQTPGMHIACNLRLIARLMTRSWQKVWRRPVTLVFSFAQPLFWMLFFGFLMHRYPLAALPPNISYISFLVPGIAVMTVMMGATQAGVSLVRDMQTGFLQRMLYTTAPRWVLHSGKMVADASRLLLQAVGVVFLGILLGATLHISLFVLLQSLLALLAFAMAMGSLSCIIALRAKRHETLSTFVHLVNMPLFFTSTALVPHKQMPNWLAAIAAWNPLTLVVETLRGGLLPIESATASVALSILIFLGILTMILAIYELKRGVSGTQLEHV